MQLEQVVDDVVEGVSRNDSHFVHPPPDDPVPSELVPQATVDCFVLHCELDLEFVAWTQKRNRR